KGALLVEVANHGNHNLHLSSRNLAGIELISSSEVHPYHLLRYDRAIFSQPAIEKLQVSLKNLSSKREHKAGEGDGAKKAQKKAARSPRTRTKRASEVAYEYEDHISDYSPAGNYREGPGHQGKPEHAGLPGFAQGEQDGDQRSGAGNLQSESELGAHGELSGERAAARKVCRVSSGLEEGVRKIAGRREDAGVRAEFVNSIQLSAISHQLNRWRFC